MGKKGYFVQGAFVEHGSETDQELRAEHTDSRTAAKRRMQALQELGEELVALKESQIRRLPASEQLTEALLQAKAMPRREARRRQVQYIGKLMRREDAAALEQALQLTADSAARVDVQEAEQWRSRLLRDDAAVQEWVAAYPETDVQRLRSLIRQARRDAQRLREQQAQQMHGVQGDAVAEAGAGAKAGGTKNSAFRQLFQLLREQLSPDV